MAVKGLHLFCAVEAVVAVAGLVVRRQVAGVVVLELPFDQTVGLRADGAVGVVLIRRQPVPIILLRSHFSKRASKSQAGMDAPPMSWRHRRRFWTYLL